MNHYILPLLFIAIVYAVMIILNETIGLFRDNFSSPGVKILAYVWIGICLFLLTLLIVASSLAPPTAKDLARVPFYSLFTLHVILIIFLFVWWLLTGRPPVARFLNIRSEHPGEAVLTGLAVGVGGWIVTILLALTIALILQSVGLLPKRPEPSGLFFLFSFGLSSILK